MSTELAPSAETFLSEQSVNKNPFILFEQWFDKALKSGFKLPNAMTLATSKKGRPSARVVLLKGFDEAGFVFYTNYKSRKGKELEKNPYAALLFYWDKLDRQVRIEGKVKKVSKQESEKYFATRPYESRLGAWASNQSSVIKDRAALDNLFANYMKKYPDSVPLPKYWGGYRLKPDLFEFWQGQKNRLHDRIMYTRKKKSWKIQRLAP
jgi:pyridoxamine 5'-phosphate oxidase